ncbi:MmyB family transcriptional regulator [Streptomyces phaeochromogenes]|uniref:MmyB family transcriptional regulator n=1 Tax=Streptomyces phaeochromogenes TaxID=1923 RepID=UPI00369B455E
MPLPTKYPRSGRERLGLLAPNHGGLRLLPGIEDWPARERNIARYLFLHLTARTLFHDWNTQIRGCVVGDLTLGYQTMELEGAPGHRMVPYCTQPDTTDHDAMVLHDMLGSQSAPHASTALQDESTSSST